MTAVRQETSTPAGVPLTAGPRWYRARIRTIGPLLGIVPMLVLGGVSWIALRAADGRASGLIGLVAGVSAAPGLLVAGAPFADDTYYPLAVVASIPLWLVLGLLASRRATTRTMAGWGDYGRELILLAVAVVIGAAAALFVASTILGESLIS